MDTPSHPADRAALADLHRHLDGSLRPTTLAELARERGVELPGNVRFHPGMGLGAALDCFRLTLSVLQQPAAVRRVAAEMCEDAAAEGVATLEIRFAPQLHGGAPLEAIVDAALEGVAGRAGLVVCALYGEDPAIALRLVEIGATRPGVVGLDLAGGPSPAHGWSLDDYAPAFSAARDHGMGRTVHASEGRPPSEIRTAITTLHAQRIGHGTTLLDDPHVLDLVVRSEVTLEACITSNMQTGVIPTVLDHPLPRWLRLGVRACVCTDNTLFSDVTSQSEHALAASLAGMTPALVAASSGYGHAAAFPLRPCADSRPR